MKWEVAVRKTVGDAAHPFSLDMSFASDARRLVLFGPSGAGKTMTLKAIAGLVRPDAGRIVFDGEPVFDAAAGVDVPARSRRLGYLFQEYALFPHLTVRQNIAFGLDAGVLNPRRGRADAVTDRWLEALELRRLEARFPDQLSGGQRQRVALARALAAQPRALLLDEPFAALDVSLRGRLRAELHELQARFPLPILLITHDSADVDAFADEIVYVDAGRAVGARVPEVQELPMRSSARNHLAGRVSRIVPGAVNDEVEIALPGGQHLVAIVTRESVGRLGLAVGADAFAMVKASSVIVVADLEGARLSARNQLAGRVVRLQPGAVNAEVVIDVGGGTEIAAIVTQGSAASLALAPGAAATAVFKATSVILGVPR